MNGDFIMPIGKYEGETLEEIYEKDQEYLEWIYNEGDDFDNDEVYEEVEDFLEDIGFF